MLTAVVVFVWVVFATYFTALDSLLSLANYFRKPTHGFLPARNQSPWCRITLEEGVTSNDAKPQEGISGAESLENGQH